MLLAVTMITKSMQIIIIETKNLWRYMSEAGSSTSWCSVLTMGTVLCVCIVRGRNDVNTKYSLLCYLGLQQRCHTSLCDAATCFLYDRCLNVKFLSDWL